MPPDDPDATDRERSGRDLLDRLDGDSSTPARLLGDLYRAEVDRATTWRSRLDQTTNWAVVFVAAILTWSFSSPDNPHYVILIGMFGVVAFLLIEANRYREYDIWRARLRLLQEHVFVGLFAAPPSASTDWQSKLRDSYADPSYTMSFRDAVGHRIRRIYFALLAILLAAWIARITVFETGRSWRRTAAIPGLGGEFVVLVVCLFFLVVVAVALWSTWGTTMREANQ